MQWKEFLNKVNNHYGNKANFIWASAEFLAEKELRPVVDIPVWEPRNRRAGRHTMSAQKAIDAGMTFTPMEETFDNALKWYDHIKSPNDDPGLDKSRPFNGISRKKELKLLAEWDAYLKKKSKV